MSDASRLDELLDRWEQIAEQQRDITAEELCRECPELLEPLRRRIDALKAMRWLTRLEGSEELEPTTEPSVDSAPARDQRGGPNRSPSRRS